MWSTPFVFSFLVGRRHIGISCENLSHLFYYISVYTYCWMSLFSHFVFKLSFFVLLKFLCSWISIYYLFLCFEFSSRQGLLSSGYAFFIAFSICLLTKAIKINPELSNVIISAIPLIGITSVQHAGRLAREMIPVSPSSHPAIFVLLLQKNK